MKEFVFDMVENSVGKGENGSNQDFSPFFRSFSKSFPPRDDKTCDCLVNVEHIERNFLVADKEYTHHIEVVFLADGFTLIHFLTTDFLLWSPVLSFLVFYAVIVVLMLANLGEKQPNVIHVMICIWYFGRATSIYFIEIIDFKYDHKTFFFYCIE